MLVHSLTSSSRHLALYIRRSDFLKNEALGLYILEQFVDTTSWQSRNLPAIELTEIENLSFIRIVTVSLDRQKDMNWNSSVNPTNLFKNN